MGYNPSRGAIVVGSNKYTQTNGPPRVHNGDMWVTDLEIDCNAEGLSATNSVLGWNFQGVELWSVGGSHIERVRVINAVGFHPITENFILSINAPSDIELSRSNRISECEVSQFYNPAPADDGHCSAISLNMRIPNLTTGRIEGTVEDCHVELNGNDTRVA
jgi:hypothetical protein